MGAVRGRGAIKVEYDGRAATFESPTRKDSEDRKLKAEKRRCMLCGKGIWL